MPTGCEFDTDEYVYVGYRTAASANVYVCGRISASSVVRYPRSDYYSVSATLRSRALDGAHEIVR